MTEGDPARGVQVRTSDQVPDCPACSGPGILSALVSRAIKNGRGEDVAGAGVAVLCPRCDVDDFFAGPLLTFFAVHGQLSTEVLEEAAPLLRRWALNAQVKPPNQERLEEEYELWSRGEL